MSRRMTSCVIMVFVVSLLFSIVCWSRRLDEGKDAIDWKSLIKSDMTRERISARQAVLDKREDVIEYLLSVVNSPVEQGEPFYISTTPRNIAMFLLGKLRAVEAVPHLMNWLKPKPGQSGWRLHSGALSPAGDALMGIGLSSIPPVLELLKTEETNSLYYEQYIRIIVIIKGLPETELLFENAIAKETDPRKRENLKAALDRLKDPKSRKILENVYNIVHRLE